MPCDAMVRCSCVYIYAESVTLSFALFACSVSFGLVRFVRAAAAACCFFLLPFFVCAVSSHRLLLGKLPQCVCLLLSQSHSRCLCNVYILCTQLM